MELKVQEIGREDWYKDVVRMDKHDFTTFGVKKGDAVQLRVRNGTSAVGFLRGSTGIGVIEMDGNLRRRLNVEKGQQYDFSIRKAPVSAQLRWALQASDPAYRIASMFALIALFLGVVAVLIAVPPLLKDLR